MKNLNLLLKTHRNTAMPWASSLLVTKVVATKKVGHESGCPKMVVPSSNEWWRGAAEEFETLDTEVEVTNLGTTDTDFAKVDVIAPAIVKQR